MFVSTLSWKMPRFTFHLFFLFCFKLSPACASWQSFPPHTTLACGSTVSSPAYMFCLHFSTASFYLLSILFIFIAYIFICLFISYSCTSFFAWCTYRVCWSCSNIVDICCCQSCISWMHSAAFCAWSLKWASDAVNDAEAFELADLARACTTKARVFLQWWIIIFILHNQFIYNFF